MPYKKITQYQFQARGTFFYITQGKADWVEVSVRNAGDYGPWTLLKKDGKWDFEDLDTRRDMCRLLYSDAANAVLVYLNEHGSPYKQSVCC